MLAEILETAEPPGINLSQPQARYIKTSIGWTNVTYCFEIPLIQLDTILDVSLQALNGSLVNSVGSCQTSRQAFLGLLCCLILGKPLEILLVDEPTKNQVVTYLG